MSKDPPDSPTQAFRVPNPAHPVRRAESLPWQTPKSTRDDPLAETRIQAIMRNPSYRRADQDVAFLGLDETRGPRLELDYMKPEIVLRENGVEHTIVVFGSTRICEPTEARRRLEDASSALSLDPADASLRRRLQVAERLVAKSRFYEIARDFGRLVGEFGNGQAGNRILLMTGGGPGIMEAANRGAFDVGAKTVGLNITLPHEQFPNPYITPDLCFSVHYFAVRKLHFLLRAKALVVFPGGFGTLDELFETLTLVQTRKIKPLPVVLVGRDYWLEFFDLDFLVREGVIDEEDRDLFWYAETADEIWNGILSWHVRSGDPLSASTATPAGR